jgi:hypothetical protein
MGSFARPRP